MAATDGIWTSLQGGYHQTGSDGGNPFPLLLMLQRSYTDTTKGQGAPAR